MPHAQMMEERLRFLNIDQNTLSDLQNARDILETEMDDMLDRFYSHILQEPSLQELFIDKDSMNRARSEQRDYWLGTLFDGRYDETYFDKAAQIGRAHARVGLTPNWYIGGYCQMLNQFIEQISKIDSDEEKPATDVIRAMNKAIFLDMDLVIHSYLDAKNNSMRQILQRATHFASDVKALIDGINATTKQIKGTAENLSAAAGDQSEAPSTGSDTQAEIKGDTIGHISTLKAQAEQLSEQMSRLNERLDELQFGDRLYIADSAPKARLLERLKTLVWRK